MKIRTDLLSLMRVAACATMALTAGCTAHAANVTTGDLPQPFPDVPDAEPPPAPPPPPSLPPPPPSEPPFVCEACGMG